MAWYLVKNRDNFTFYHYSLDNVKWKENVTGNASRLNPEFCTNHLTSLFLHVKHWLQVTVYNILQKPYS